MLCTAEPFRISDFLTLPDLETFVGGLAAEGGGDEPESGLEALAVAPLSPWAQAGEEWDSVAHIVVQSGLGLAELSPEEFLDLMSEMIP